MKIAVRYQSRGGNTRAVANIIAEVLGVKAEPIDVPLDENVDVLFLGGGVYKWDADPQLKEYLKNLDAQKIGQIVAFSTTGGMNTAVTRIAEYAVKAGIMVNSKKFVLRVLLQGHSALGREGGHLTAEQVGKVKQFTNNVFEDLRK
jgi:Flavodoxins